jgi:hypothetical protein
MRIVITPLVETWPFNARRHPAATAALLSPDESQCERSGIFAAQWEVVLLHRCGACQLFFLIPEIIAVIKFADWTQTGEFRCLNSFINAESAR